MAAILEPHRLLDPAPVRSTRPELRLIQGGATRRPPARTVSPLLAGLMAFLVVVAVLAGSIALGRGALAALSPSAPPAAAAPRPGDHLVRVRAGDTIWSIARRLQPTGDIRPLVDRLVAANGSAAIQAGDRLIVPA